MNAGAPLIGVTTSEIRLGRQVEQTPEGEPPRREMALGMLYAKAIEAAGGVPVVMPPMALTRVPDLMNRLDGLCLSGGPDLDPAAYHASRHPMLGPTEPELDRFEIEVVQAAWAKRLPLLAICRGAQALNVARGGTLHQHLPESAGSAIEHRQKHPADQVAHPVRVAARSRLRGLIGRDALEVNSFHHQAAAIVGRGLRAVAWSPDGVIEGLEARDHGFVLGVQWHAECMAERPEQALLFSALVEASSHVRAGAGEARAA